MSRRRLVLIIGLGVAALVVVATVGRPTSSTDPRHDRVANEAPIADSQPGHAAGGGTGDGNHSAFPRTSEGAVAAAATYALAIDNPQIFDRAHREQMLDDIAAEATRAELSEAVDGALDRIEAHLAVDVDAASDPGFVWRSVPGGWRVMEYDNERATIAIWAASIAIMDGHPLVEPGWLTSFIDLVWERGDWRLVAFGIEVGPDPGRLPGDVSAVARQINGFAPFHHWPDQAAPERDR